MLKNTFFDALEKDWPILVIFLMVISILRIAYLKNNGKKLTIYKEVMMLIALAYFFLLFELVTLNISTGGTNFMPFKEILRYDPGTKEFYQFVIGNILIFVPFGFFATYYVKIKKIRIIFLISLITSLAIEGVQYFIGRYFDVDDLLLNVIGGVAGFLLYIGLDAIRKHLPEVLQKDIIYNILSILLVIGIIIYFLSVYQVWAI